METKADRNFIVNIARILNYIKYNYVEAPGYVGGLAVFWCPFVKLTVAEKFSNFFLFKVPDVMGKNLNE